MPLNVPDLDDRRYADLVEEALAMLPRYAPGWTNHNASDPGITLVELLAYFTEHFVYRLNRITRETRIRFLQLLSGVERYRAEEWDALSAETVDRELRQVVGALHRPERAVTAEDYEQLAREATADNPPTLRIGRSRAFVRQNLAAPDDASRARNAPGHVTVVAVPADEVPEFIAEALRSQVRDHLESRRLLTTRLHVVEPFFLYVRIRATLHLRPEADEELRATAETVLAALQEFGSPGSGGGPQGEGWPFGRALYVSEVYERLERLNGVDYVDGVDVIGLSTREEDFDAATHIGIKVGGSIVGVDSWLSARGGDRVLVDSAGRLTGIALRPWELLRIASRAEDFSIAEGSRGGSRVEPGRRASSGASGAPPAPEDAAAPGLAATVRDRSAEDRPGRPTDREGRRGTTGGRLLAELPGLYHASPDLRQLLGAFETILCEPYEGALEQQIARIAMLFDVLEAPRHLPGWLSERRDALLPWLTQWVALSGTVALPSEDLAEERARRRRLIGHIVPLYARRGTRHYVTELLKFSLPDGVEIRVNDQEFAGLVLGRARIGVDAWLADDRPFWFKVTIRMPETAPAALDPNDWRERIRHVIDLAKPAHTTYELELVAPRTDM